MSVIEMEELGFLQLEAEGFDVDEELQPVYIPPAAPAEIHQVRAMAHCLLENLCYSHCYSLSFHIVSIKALGNTVN